MIALFRSLRTGLLAAAMLLPMAAAAQFQEGADYRRQQQPMENEAPGKIEVVEFFSFGCPHCAHFEAVLGPWVKKLPADVQFRRVPVMMYPDWVGLAKVFYTLDSMGEAGRLADAAFNAVQKQNQPLHQEKVFAEWAGKQGLDARRAAETYQSFAVSSRIARAKQLAVAQQIHSVPMLIIDGKYATSPSMAGNSHTRALAVADFLLAKARAERGGTQAATPAANSAKPVTTAKTVKS